MTERKVTTVMAEYPNLYLKIKTGGTQKFLKLLRHFSNLIKNSPIFLILGAEEIEKFLNLVRFFLLIKPTIQSKLFYFHCFSIWRGISPPPDPPLGTIHNISFHQTTCKLKLWKNKKKAKTKLNERSLSIEEIKE